MEIKIARDFSNSPGGRFIAEGNYSGEEFREQLLLPKFREARNKGEKLIINFDGTYGYATTFLDESFGRLADKIPSDELMNTLVFKSNEQPSIIKLVEKYIFRK